MTVGETPDLSGLTPDLVDRLGSLLGQPEGVPEIALSALGYGSRTALLAQGIIEQLDVDGNPVEALLPRTPVEIVITEYGNRVIEACARAVPRHGVAPSLAEVINSQDDAALPVPASSGTALELGAVACFSGPPPELREVVEHVRSKLHLAPRFRQTAAMPTGSAGPLWIEDADFDVSGHVQRVTLPGQGTSEDLKRLVAGLFSERLDPTRPTWGVWVIDGFNEDAFALVSKFDHTIVDGMSGVDLTTMLYDLEGSSNGNTARVWDDGAPVSSRGTVAGILDRVGQVAVTMPKRVVAARKVGLQTKAGEVVSRWLQIAPSSPLNVPVGFERRVAFAQTRLDLVREIRKSFGTTTTAVLLAAISGSLRAWLLGRKLDVTGVELRAALVSTRPHDGGRPLGSQLTNTLVPLPLGVEDPVARLKRIDSALQAQRRDSSRRPLIDHVPSTIRSLVSRLLASSRAYNLAVVNLPGSQVPLSVLGRRMTSLHPLAFVAPDHALSVSIVSYDGGLYFGLIGDAEELHDITAIASGVQAEIDRLYGLIPDRSLELVA